MHSGIQQSTIQAELYIEINGPRCLISVLILEENKYFRLPCLQYKWKVMSPLASLSSWAGTYWTLFVKFNIKLFNCKFEEYRAVSLLYLHCIKLNYLKTGAYKYIKLSWRPLCFSNTLSKNNVERREFPPPPAVYIVMWSLSEIFLLIAN